MKFLVIFAAVLLCVNAYRYPYIDSDSSEEYHVLVPSDNGQGQGQLDLSGLGIVQQPVLQAVKVKVPRYADPLLKQQLIQQYLAARGLGDLRITGQIRGMQIGSQQLGSQGLNLQGQGLQGQGLQQQGLQGLDLQGLGLRKKGLPALYAERIGAQEQGAQGLNAQGLGAQGLGAQGQSTQGLSVQERSPQGQAVQGQAVQGQASAALATEGVSTQGPSAQEQYPQGQSSQGQSSQIQTSQGQSAQGVTSPQGQAVEDLPALDIHASVPSAQDQVTLTGLPEQALTNYDAGGQNLSNRDWLMRMLFSTLLPNNQDWGLINIDIPADNWASRIRRDSRHTRAVPFNIKVHKDIAKVTPVPPLPQRDVHIPRMSDLPRIRGNRAVTAAAGAAATTTTAKESGAHASSAHQHATSTPKNCDIECTKLHLSPVCAFNGECYHEFANQCVMDTFVCKHPDLGFKAAPRERCSMHWLKRCSAEELKSE